MEFGRILSELRKENGLTQEALAEKLGVSRQAVTKWEADESVPELLKLWELADLFGTSIDKLIGRDNTTLDIILSRLEETDDEEDDDNVDGLKLIASTIRVLQEMGTDDKKILDIMLNVMED